jgi:hypothetical protein
MVVVEEWKPLKATFLEDKMEINAKLLYLPSKNMLSWTPFPQKSLPKRRYIICV